MIEVFSPTKHKNVLKDGVKSLGKDIEKSPASRTSRNVAPFNGWYTFKYFGDALIETNPADTTYGGYTLTLRNKTDIRKITGQNLKRNKCYLAQLEIEYSRGKWKATITNMGTIYELA